MSNIQFHTMPDGRRIAYRLCHGTGPTLVFLPGYMSDMDGGKATALFEQSKAKGRACLLLDYSGCGKSSGDFADGTLSRWCEEVLALIDAYIDGPILLAGSSMGGWLMLLAAAHLQEKLTGIVGIASAPDFTRWDCTEEQRALLMSGRILYEDNPYGPEPTPTHPGFFKDADAQLQLNEEIAITCPVRLLHGQKDDVVPYDISLKLAAALRSDDVQVTLIKDGDHRLSRDADIALLMRTIDPFY